MNAFRYLRENFSRPNNSLRQIILLNVIVYVLLLIVLFIAKFSQNPALFIKVYEQFTIPAQFTIFLERPWSMITYAFNHALNYNFDLFDIFHIAFNMLVLYWFGNVITEFLGNQKLVNLYIYGALSGAILYLLSYNLIPYFVTLSHNTSGMVGSSAAVYAIAVAAATLLPDYRFFLFFFGSVKIKYIVAVYIGLSILGTIGENAGGNLAHLGGALIGFAYIKALRAGTDIGQPLTFIFKIIKKPFQRKSPIKVTHRKTSQKEEKPKRSPIDQAEIDAILDKISESGYSSLTKEEKQKLFEASKY